MHPRGLSIARRLVLVSLAGLALAFVVAQAALATTWSGTVTNEAGEPLPGITVTLDHWTDELLDWQRVVTTSTDAEGKYSAYDSFPSYLNEYLLGFHDASGQYEDNVTWLGSESDWHSFTLDVVLKQAGQGPDTTPPVTTDNAPTGWVTTTDHLNMAVRVTLTATDDESGVAGTWYRGNEGDSWLQGTTINFLIAADHRGDGIYRIDYYSVDVAGNTEVPKTCFVRIDTTEPAASLPAEQLSTGSIELSVLDDLSPTCAARVQVLKPAGGQSSSHKGNRVVADFSVDLPADGSLQTVALPDGVGPGKYRLRVTATDLAGNAQSVPATAQLQVRP